MSAFSRFAGVYAVLNAADDVADHWVQTSDQAEHKGDDSAEGRAACARHVVTLVATQAIALGAVCAATGQRFPAGRTVLGLAVGAATHYWADRRAPLATLARKTRKDGFYEFGDPKAAPTGTGAYALDQAFHHLWRAVSAVIIAGRD